MTVRKDGEDSCLFSTMEGPYADHILDARDVCSNCFRRNRVERVDPVMSRGLRHELDAHLSRRKQMTTREHHDSDPKPTNCDATFCVCGIEGSHHRMWDPTDIGRSTFKTLLTRGLETLGEKGISFSRNRKKEIIGYALTEFDDSGDADKALSKALEMGIVAKASAATNEQ